MHSRSGVLIALDGTYIDRKFNSNLFYYNCITCIWRRIVLFSLDIIYISLVSFYWGRNLSEVPKVLLLVYVRASELRAIFGDRPRWKITYHIVAQKKK